jgi:hypothetical protein
LTIEIENVKYKESGQSTTNLSSPRALDQHGIQHLLPTMQALHVGLSVAHDLGDPLPVLAVELLDRFTQTLVLAHTKHRYQEFKFKKIGMHVNKTTRQPQNKREFQQSTERFKEISSSCSKKRM